VYINTLQIALYGGQSWQKHGMWAGLKLLHVRPVASYVNALLGLFTLLLWSPR